jgi:hypothetical protein
MKSEHSFSDYLFVKEKKNKLISLKTSDILAKDERTLTLSFLKHLVIVDLFLKKFIIGVYSNVLKQIYAFTLDLVTSTFWPSNTKFPILLTSSINYKVDACKSISIAPCTEQFMFKYLFSYDVTEVQL